MNIGKIDQPLSSMTSNYTTTQTTDQAAALKISLSHLKIFLRELLTQKDISINWPSEESKSIIYAYKLACEFAIETHLELINGPENRIPLIKNEDFYLARLNRIEAKQLYQILTGNTEDTKAQDLKALCQYQAMVKGGGRREFFTGENIADKTPLEEFYQFINSGFKLKVEQANLTLDEQLNLPQVGMLPLPSELQSAIFSLVPERSYLCNLRWVNRKTYQFINNNIHPLKYLKVNPDTIKNEVKFNQFLSYLTSSDCRTVALDLSRIDLSGNTIEKLLEALEKNTTVTGLNLSACGLKDKDLIGIGKLIKLTSLNLSKNKFEYTSGITHLLSLVNLKVLDLSDSLSVLAFSPYDIYPKLEEIEAYSAELKSKLPNLTSLNFTHEQLIKAIAIWSIASAFGW